MTQDCSEDSKKLANGELLAKAVNGTIYELKDYLVHGGCVPRESMALSWVILETMLKNEAVPSELVTPELAQLYLRISKLEALVSKKDECLREINRRTATESSETGLRIDISNLSSAALAINAGSEKRKAFAYEITAPDGKRFLSYTKTTLVNHVNLPLCVAEVNDA